jgi:subtilisin family serine protease
MIIGGSRAIGVSLAALVAAGLCTSPALAKSKAKAPAPAPVNPNADEWKLIGLNAADVAGAQGGSGVKVALLDGLTDCRDTDLSGRCTSVKLSGGRYSRYDTHGTHTAGIIAGAKYGVATSATILNYAVFDDRGYVATGSKLADAWRGAGAQGASIASMSFGCAKTALCFSTGEIQTMADSSLKLLYVKAAGNDGVALGNETSAVDANAASAAMARLILVGSVNVNGAISSFSNRPGDGCLLSSGTTSCTADTAWKKHFITAPGELIYSTLPNNTYGNMSGTSMATPVVAGVAGGERPPRPTPKKKTPYWGPNLITTPTHRGAPR